MSRRRPLVLVPAALGIALLTVGCTADRPSQVEPDTRAAIGYAATARYPTTPAQRSDQTVAAVVNYPSTKQIEILNLSQNAIPTPSVWVNGAYVRRIQTIPPQGTVTLRYANLLQAGQAQNDFSMMQQPVTKVEIETNNGFYTVLGPAVKR
jgi:hypothetical protein